MEVSLAFLGPLCCLLLSLKLLNESDCVRARVPALLVKLDRLLLRGDSHTLGDDPQVLFIVLVSEGYDAEFLATLDEVQGGFVTPQGVSIACLLSRFGFFGFFLAQYRVNLF